MSTEPDFDVIVVGAGVAGCIAAYTLANAGLSVMAVERGSECGEKEMTGGRIYTHSLEQAMPGATAKAPLERRVTKERISFTTKEAAMTIDFTEAKEACALEDSYTVLSSRFVKWLGQQAEDAGAMMACGIRVDDLIVRDGRVCGIVAGGDEIEAKYVVLADGVNSLLAEKAGIKQEMDLHRYAVGAKELIELDEKTVSDRFGVAQGEGVAWLFAGGASEGAYGGGFLYTNKDTVSIGIIRTLADIERGEMTLPLQLEEFKKHPAVAPLIAGGKCIEYSGHMVPEPGLDFVPSGNQLHVPGLLAVGDVAGLIVNIGFMVRGLDLAVASGQFAAEAIAEALSSGSEAGPVYEGKLKNSFVLKEMDVYKKFPLVMTNHRIFNEYPEMLTGLMSDMFTVRADAQPASLLSKIMARIKGAGGLKPFIGDFKGIYKALK